MLTISSSYIFIGVDLYFSLNIFLLINVAFNESYSYKYLFKGTGQNC